MQPETVKKLLVHFEAQLSCIKENDLVDELNFFFVAPHPLGGQILLSIKALRSHSVTHAHSVGLPWTIDQPDAETST